MEKSLHHKITEALMVLRPNAEWTLIGEDYSELEWLDKNQTAPNWAEVEAEINNPTPKLEATTEEKLASVGLKVSDLKAALGL